MVLMDTISKILDKYNLDDYEIGGDAKVTEIILQHDPISLELLEEINIVAEIDAITTKDGFIQLIHVTRKGE